MENENPPLRILRKLLLGLVVLGLAGTALDLVLLGHYEDANQIVPLALIGISLVISVWHWVRPARVSLRAFKVSMLLLAAGGLLGMWLHFQGNREFQLEMDPNRSGLELFMRVIRAHSPPAMAPGSLVQFALFGLLYCFRHPAGSHATQPGP